MIVRKKFMERIGTDTLHFDHPSKKGAHFMSDTIS